MKHPLHILALLILLLLVADPALADGLTNQGVLNEVASKFQQASSSWGTTISSAATRLFWALAVISMVWTFGMMLLRQADIGEFFAEFIRFIVFTGFFWWLLENATSGMNIAGSVIDSMRQLGAEAAGVSDTRLGPSAILDLGFHLYAKVCTVTSHLGWREIGTILVMQIVGIAILLTLAIVAINLLLALISSWILLYAGVFFLGFGGSRWTTDMALKYYRAILGVATQLYGMLLLVALGKSILTNNMNQISDSMDIGQLAVMLIVAICILFLVDKVPSMLAGLAGGSLAQGISNFGAGQAIGAAQSAMHASAMAGRMVGQTVMGTAGAVSAVKAAYSKAQANLANAQGSGTTGQNAQLQNKATTSTNTPYARAAGMDTKSTLLALPPPGETAADKKAGQPGPTPGNDSRRTSSSATGEEDAGKAEGTENTGGADDQDADFLDDGIGTEQTDTFDIPVDSAGQPRDRMARAASLATETARELAQGTGRTIKDKIHKQVTKTRDEIHKRVSQTFGGQVAATINAGVDQMPPATPNAEAFSGEGAANPAPAPETATGPDVNTPPDMTPEPGPRAHTVAGETARVLAQGIAQTTIPHTFGGQVAANIRATTPTPPAPPQNGSPSAAPQPQAEAATQAPPPPPQTPPVTPPTATNSVPPRPNTPPAPPPTGTPMPPVMPAPAVTTPTPTTPAPTPAPVTAAAATQPPAPPLLPDHAQEEIEAFRDREETTYP